MITTETLTAQDVIMLASRLSRAEQASVITALVQHLAAPDIPMPPPLSDSEFRAVVVERLEDARRNPAASVPGEPVIARLRQLAGQDE